jgi:lipoprotein-releasing system permease protein
VNIQLCWQIANKFRQQHQSKSGYLSFMSVSAISGIALGCFVLIMLLSVMNGFEKELRDKLLSVIPHGEIFAVSADGLRDWQDLKNQLENDVNVKFVTPYTQVAGLIQHKETLKPVALSGLAIGPNEITMFSSAVRSEDLNELKTNPSGMILGKHIADELRVQRGDTIDFLIPPHTEDNKFSAAKKVQFTVLGILQLGGEIDGKLGLISLSKASELMAVKSGVQGLRVTMHDPFKANSVVRQYGYYFDQAVYMSDWTRTHGHIFQDIQLVRVVVYIVLTLVIAVACFNVVSSLVMGVKAKQASIAILLSMGATPSLVQTVFLIQGLLNGVFGTAYGVIAALIVVPNLSLIVGNIESLFGTKLLSTEVYFIDFLPSAMHLSDVVFTIVISLFLSLIAAFYPARRAARIQPAQVLA